MRIVGLIPLRGGSQRIIKKNLREIAGKPLAFWICSAAVKSKSLDAVYVSTESSEIREVVQGFGLGIEVLDRPFEFATESATTDSVLMHFKEHGPFDIVVTLQATSPLTTPDDIDRAVSQLLRDGNDSLLSGTITQRFYWSFDGRPLNYDYERRPRSQDFTGSFMENGALYVTRREILERFSNRLGGSIGLFVMSSDCAVELDESSDWPVVERLLLGTRNYLAIVVPRIQIVFMDFDGVWTDNMVSLNSSGEESLAV